MTRIFAFLLLLLTAGAATAQTAPAPTPPIPPGVTPKTYPASKLGLADGVTNWRDLTYATIKGYRPLTLDVYQPAQKKGAGPIPLVVYVHGGEWQGGNAREGGTFNDFPGVLAGIAAKGYVVASINYRLSGEAHFPAALQDVKSAIRWLRDHAADYGIDTTRVAVWGASAGGQLAALAGTSCGVAALEPVSDIPPQGVRPNLNGPALASDCVQGVIDWYGITDLETLAADNGHAAADPSAVTPEGLYLGCEIAQCTAVTVHAASPMTYLASTSPPFLIQQGALDTTVSPKQSQKLYDALKAAGVPAELVMYPGVAHDFAKVPFAPDAATNKLALEKVEAFLAQIFPKSNGKAAKAVAARTKAPAQAKPAGSKPVAAKPAPAKKR
jgi:acetyl esterase/lipase